MSESMTEAKPSQVLQELGINGMNPGGARHASPGDFAGNLGVVMRIPVTVKVLLGTTTMPVASLLKLNRGAVIPLDRRVGDPVELVINDHVVARGEVVVLSEDSSRFGISLTDVIGMPDAEKAGR